MKNIIIYILIMLYMAYSCKLRVKFNPFEITFEEWRHFLAIILLSISLLLFMHHEYQKGYTKGVNDAMDWTLKTLKENLKLRKHE